MRPFTYTALPARVEFGAGTLALLPGLIRSVGARALILSTPQQADRADALARTLGPLAAGVFAGATMHTPVDVTARAAAALRDAGADCVVALGGGSTIGLGKALAWRTDVPQIAVPTTYAGSEATPILGETADGRKTTRRDPRILPEIICYDVDLTLGLPVTLSVTSGMNAIAHAIEALYAEHANPVTAMLAERGIAAMAGAMPRIRVTPADPDARADALFGAWACGTCLGSVGMALHHNLCHVLGGTWDLPHAQTHCVVLPHAAAYNAPAAPDAMARAAAALGAPDAPRALFDLAAALGAPTALRDLGLPHDALDRAAARVAEIPYWNPRAVTQDGVRALLDDAWHGRRPGGTA